MAALEGQRLGLNTHCHCFGFGEQLLSAAFLDCQLKTQQFTTRVGGAFRIAPNLGLVVNLQYVGVSACFVEWVLEVGDKPSRTALNT